LSRYVFRALLRRALARGPEREKDIPANPEDLSARKTYLRILSVRKIYLLTLNAKITGNDEPFPVICKELEFASP